MTCRRLAPGLFLLFLAAAIGPPAAAIDRPHVDDWRPSPNVTRTGGRPIQYVIIHTMQGPYGSALNWFANPASRVSAHFSISKSGRLGQSVAENDIGWHSGNSTYNRLSVGIEHEGYVSDPNNYTDAMLRKSAALTRYLCDRYRIPIDRQHIVGHVEVPGTNHTDPGPHFPWARYMDLVRQAGAPAPAPAPSPPRVFPSWITAGANADGRLEVFYVRGANLYHAWQWVDGRWSPPFPLVGGGVWDLSLARHATGRLEMFLVGFDKKLRHTWQSRPNGNWIGPADRPGWGLQIANVTHPDSRVEFFYVGTNHGVYHQYQEKPGGPWSGEAKRPGLARQIEAATNQDGRAEIFTIGLDGMIYHQWIQPGGKGWTGEHRLGGPAFSHVVGKNVDGRLEVFYIGADLGIYHLWQVTPNGTWYGPARRPGKALQLAVDNNADGRLELFYVGTNKHLYHQAQLPGGGWSGEMAMHGWANQIATARNRDGRLELFSIGTNGGIYHQWQWQANGAWSGEANLIPPP